MLGEIGMCADTFAHRRITAVAVINLQADSVADDVDGEKRRQQPDDRCVECRDDGHRGHRPVAFHRPMVAPVGSTMIESQPAPITSIGSRITLAPSLRAFSVAAWMSSTLTQASHDD